MDPVANLWRQRELAGKIISTTARLDPPAAVERHAGPLISGLVGDATELAEHVLALDEWRLKDGFDPYKTSPAQREVLRAMRDIVQYNWQSEERHYEEQVDAGEVDPSENLHVFTKLTLVDRFLTEQGVE